MALRACAHQLVEVFTSIFNLSLNQPAAPTCFKQTTIIMKCFERQNPHLVPPLPDTLDPLPFAHHPNRSTDTIVLTVHIAFFHQDKGNIGCGL